MKRQCEQYPGRHPQAGADGDRCGGRGNMPLSVCSDEDLLAQYAQLGTSEAFEELSHRYEQPLHAYLSRYLGDASMAEDTFQAAFLEVHLHCREFDPNRPFKPWLYRIATTRAIDLMRRNRRHELAGLDVGGRSSAGNHPTDILDAKARTPLEELEKSENQNRLRLLVDSLPARLRNALVLVMYGGLVYREAAVALDIPTSTVKSRIRNAVFRLRRILAVPV